MYRLFVAIDLPEEVKEAVANIRGDLPGARWVPREQIHLTLRFIGDADETLFQVIRKRLAEVKARHFPLALEGIGYFPPGPTPRVLWVGMTASAPLLDLQQQVEQAVQTAGMIPERRRFSPHITIARLRETPAKTVQAFEVQHSRFRTESFTVGNFYLYSSVIGNQGAVHTREAVYPLE